MTKITDLLTLVQPDDISVNTLSVIYLLIIEFVVDIQKHTYLLEFLVYFLIQTSNG
jgi:hypothetical protein